MAVPDAAAPEHGAHSLPVSSEARSCVADTAGVLRCGEGLLAAVGAVDRSGETSPGSTIVELMVVSKSAEDGSLKEP
jgi:hypothetical protein